MEFGSVLFWIWIVILLLIQFIIISISYIFGKRDGYVECMDDVIKQQINDEHQNSIIKFKYLRDGDGDGDEDNKK